MKFFNFIDLLKNELRNAKAQNVAGTPGGLVSGDAGVFWYDSTAKRLRYWDGAQTVDPATDESNWHPPVIVMSTTNITVTAPGVTINGVSPTSGDRVLLTGQTTASENGPWIWNGSAVAMTRPTDWDAAAEQQIGAVIGVRSGTANSQSLWMQTATNVWGKLTGFTLDQLATSFPATADVTLNSHKLTNVLDPTSAQDGATKNYVDNTAAGLDAKPSVRAATVGSETFTIASGAATQITGLSVDGITCAIGDRILIKDAPTTTGVGSVGSNNAANGIYVVTNSTTNLTVSRATDMDSWAKVPSAYTWVEQGTTQADTGWVVTADTGLVINSSGIQWSMFAASTTVLAGSGLIKSGNTLSVRGPGVGLVFDPGNSNQLTVGSGGGSVAAGFIGVLGTNNGGTGASTAAAARTNLGVTGKYAANIGDGASTSYTITGATHALGNADLHVQFYDKTANPQVAFITDYTINTTSFDIVISFATPPATNTIRVVVTG